jgi:hypothetical protein
VSKERQADRTEHHVPDATEVGRLVADRLFTEDALVRSSETAAPVLGRIGDAGEAAVVEAALQLATAFDLLGGSILRPVSDARAGWQGIEVRVDPGARLGAKRLQVHVVTHHFVPAGSPAKRHSRSRCHDPSP